jgi:hypothetical protein
VQIIRKKIAALVSCFFGSMIFILVLVVLAENAKHLSNHFARALPPHIVIPGNIFEFNRGNYYIAGINAGGIYVGMFGMPDRFFKVNLNLKDSQTIKISFPPSTRLYQGCYGVVDSSTAYIFDGSQPVIYSGDLSTCKMTLASKPFYFTEGIERSRNSFILRTIADNQNWLLRSIEDSSGIKGRKNLLVKQIDGIFCTDGSLLRVPKSDKILYVYYYRNQFICADTNLNLLYKGKTIDTVTHAHIKVAVIKSQGQITLASPPFYVNRKSCVNSEYLFVQSALTADNEIAKTLNEVSTIDIYSIKDGKYKYSFYLPRFRNEELRDFKVYDKTLIAFFGPYLCSFKLNI